MVLGRETRIFCQTYALPERWDCDAVWNVHFTYTERVVSTDIMFLNTTLSWGRA